MLDNLHIVSKEKHKYKGWGPSSVVTGRWPRMCKDLDSNLELKKGRRETKLKWVILTFVLFYI